MTFEDERKRRIINFDSDEQRARDCARYWSAQGTHARVYRRVVRAENLTVNVFVVVVDAEEVSP